jgi:hypothetical protein
MQMTFWAQALLPLLQGKRAMPSVSASGERFPSRNRLLSVLSDDDFALLQPHLQPVTLPLLHDMERSNRKIETVYFMEDGIASIVAGSSDEIRVEVGLIGREGMGGAAIVLGGDRSPHST